MLSLLLSLLVAVVIVVVIVVVIAVVAVVVVVVVVVVVSLLSSTPFSLPPMGGREFLMSLPCLEPQGSQFDPAFLYLLLCSPA